MRLAKTDQTWQMPRLNSLGAQVILLVLSCSGSFVLDNRRDFKCRYALSCICLLAIHRLICVPFSPPPGVGGWLRLLLVALPGRFFLPLC